MTWPRRALLPAALVTLLAGCAAPAERAPEAKPARDSRTPSPTAV